MSDVRAPFTEHYAFTGPNVAISCTVEWNREQEHYHASSSAGFHGTGTTEIAAALACFVMWMTQTGGWFASGEGEAGEPYESFVAGEGANLDAPLPGEERR